LLVFTPLVNPQRSIPRKITELTDTSNEMVMDAPKFSEMADRLRQFIDDTLFVAHNAKSDAGFIR